MSMSAEAALAPKILISSDRGHQNIQFTVCSSPAAVFSVCQSASSGPVAEGNVGAGAGATIGKIYGAPMKGGLGTASIQIPGGPVVSALAVVNALGDIWDQGRIVIGH